MASKKTVLIIFFISGFVSLALEIIWFRMLALFIPVTAYAFAVMLVAVLAGITIGSFVAHKLPKLSLAWLETTIAFAIQASLIILEIVYPFIKSVEVGNNLPLMIIASCIAIFPTTLLMGMAFPLGMKVWEKEVGKFYAVNVFGSILGALIGGFIMLPILGSQASLLLLALACLLCGMALQAAWISRFIILLCFAGVVLFVPGYYQTVLHYRYPGEKLLWLKEGIQTTVSIHENNSGFRIMYMDGRHQAEDSPAVMAVHEQIGGLPNQLFPQAKDALVIGLGGGVTPGVLSRNENLNIDIVELSDTVVEGARWFNHVNNKILDQPNVKLIVDDGRNYLLKSLKRYDIITADVIQPNHAGAGNLYSKEYFELVKRSLKPGGIVVQWIGRRAESQYKAIMRTFLDVFPNATLWANGIIMVGSIDPIPNAPVAASQMRDFVGPGPVLTDNRPFVEYYFLALPRGEEEIILTQ